MPRGPISISALRNLLAQREKELATLNGKRQRLLRELAKVDKSIAALSGQGKAALVVAKKRGKSPGRKPRKPMRTRAGRLTLRAAVGQVLGGVSSALTATEILEKLPSTGYKSASKNVDNMVRQLLYKCPEFRRVRRGKYSLKK